MAIAKTPSPPYYAVIFTALPSTNRKGYINMVEEMTRPVAEQPGFLGYESADENYEITVSYWKDLDSIKNWKANKSHQLAQNKGREIWYSAYKIRICQVLRDYDQDR